MKKIEKSTKFFGKIEKFIFVLKIINTTEKHVYSPILSSWTYFARFWYFFFGFSDPCFYMNFSHTTSTIPCPLQAMRPGRRNWFVPQNIDNSSSATFYQEKRHRFWIAKRAQKLFKTCFANRFRTCLLCYGKSLILLESKKFRSKKFSRPEKSKINFSSKINWKLLLDDTEALFTQIWPFTTLSCTYLVVLCISTLCLIFLAENFTLKFKSKFWKIRPRIFFLENIVRYTFEGAENGACVKNTRPDLKSQIRESGGGEHDLN